jgi:3-phosphoshikimate 1-carboxyvinyltransferase
VELVFAPAAGVAGVVVVPGDKSITHRAYLLALVARGTSAITGANPGADCRATLAAVRALGAVVEHAPGAASDAVRVTGCPDGLRPPAAPLDLGNSGTGLRLLAGLLAGQRVAATLVGDASLSRRPMARVVAPLAALGARLAATGAGETPPLVLAAGPELTGRAVTTEVASAQVKSAVLLAGLGARGTTTVHEPLPTRDHTERILPAFGVACERPDARTAAVTGPAAPRAAELAIPGDFSAACFWLVAGTIARAGRLVLGGVGMNPTRTGALLVLRRMGARITERNARRVGDEPVCDLEVEPAALVGADIAAEEVPSLVDELPALAIAQAVARGRSTVRGAGELRVKESDRIAAVVNALRAIGGTADELPDGWSIEGGPLAGGTVDSRGDHRLAMAFGVAALRAHGPVRVLGAEMIDTSYPAFYHAFKDRAQTR